MPSSYRTRIAPTPTGYLHLGHGRTFAHTHARARAEAGRVVLRIEDLDPQRCKPEFVEGVLDDLAWMGVDWDEGPITQSDRRPQYLSVWRRLRDGGFIYPCRVTRRELRDVSQAPHEEEEAAEPVFPPEWRGDPAEAADFAQPAGVAWRFRVPYGRVVRFEDAQAGACAFEAGRDFGDFVVWRRDDVPAYELAVVADDHDMSITEVVRGTDLLRSTARQLLLYEALGASPPQWCHLPLVRDREGRRLAKRHHALAMKTLREQGWSFARAMEALDAGTLL